MLVRYQMYTWVTSDRSAAWNWAPRVGRMTWVTTFRFFLVGSSSSLSSTLPPASLPPALYDRNNWSIVHVHVCGVKKKSASNTQYMYWLGVVTMICLANQVPVLNNSHKIPYLCNAKIWRVSALLNRVLISSYLHPSFLGPRILSYTRTTPCHHGISPHGEISEWSLF